MTAAAPLPIGEIATALGVTKRSAERRAERDGWRFGEASIRGGQQRLYDAASLPADVRDAIVARMARAVPVPVAGLPAPVPASAPTGLKDWQRRRVEARAALLQHIEQLAQAGGWDRAVSAVVDAARRSELPPPLQGFVVAANARCGEAGARALSRRSIYRWRAERNRGGAAALAPKDAPAAELPAWAPALLKLHANPQAKPLAWAHAELPKALAGTGIAAPSYDQVRRFLKRFSTVDAQRGRMGPRALKAMRPFVKRDESELDPLDVIQMDGHTFDAEVAHPVHGNPFRPEITSVIDTKTRLMLGWSVALSETAHAVMDAIHSAVMRHGMPLILYTDRGAGYEAAIISSDVVGLLARLGVTHHQSRPYNSQARGRSERAHQTVWVAGARTLPSYIGATMDAEAKKAVHKLTRRDVTMAQRRGLLMSWREFTAWCGDQVAAYNHRPHRGLGKIRDARTGLLRHTSPAEAWEAARAAGWEPTMLTVAEEQDLFRPHREVTVNRGMVQLFGNSYFAAALEHWHGQRVTVAFAIDDAKQVTVKAPDGRVICVADWEANRRAFFPVSYIERKREERLEGRARKLRGHLAEVEAEGAPPAIDVEPLTIEQEAVAADAFAALEPPPAPEPATWNGRPIFQSDEEYLAWMEAHPDQVTEQDRAWLRDQLQYPTWRMLHGESAGRIA